MKARQVKKSMNLLKGKRIEKVTVLNRMIFITFTDKALFYIDITPANRVDMYFSENEHDPVTNDDLVYSTTVKP